MSAKRALIPVFLLAVACVGALAWTTRHQFVDDAFIGFRYLANLHAGHGFVFNPGEAPVEGVTNLGWLLLLGGLGYVMPTALAAKTAGLAALLVGLGLAMGVLARLHETAEAMPSPLLAGAPLLLIATCFDIVYFALAGLETGLLFALLMALALLAAAPGRERWIGPIAGLAFMVRPEAILIAVVNAALRRDRTAWRALAIAIAIALAVSLGRVIAFGDWLPQPARAKASGIGVVLVNLRGLATGASAYLPFPLTGLPALGLMVLGWWRMRARHAALADMLGAIAATGVVFALYALPDWTELARYAAPYAAAMIMLAWTGLVALVAPRVLVVATLVALLGINALDHVAKNAGADRFPGYVLFGDRLVDPARWIAANTPRTAVIATRRIGAVGFIADRRVFDYAVGITDRDVARLHAPPERGLTDPDDPRLATLWRRVRPSHLLEDDDVIDAIARRSGGTRARFVVQGDAFRVIRAFTLGSEREWLLAERIGD